MLSKLLKAVKFWASDDVSEPILTILLYLNTQSDWEILRSTGKSIATTEYAFQNVRNGIRIKACSGFNIPFTIIGMNWLTEDESYFLTRDLRILLENSIKNNNTKEREKMKELLKC